MEVLKLAHLYLSIIGDVIVWPGFRHLSTFSNIVSEAVKPIFTNFYIQAGGTNNFGFVPNDLELKLL